MTNPNFSQSCAGRITAFNWGKEPQVQVRVFDIKGNQILSRIPVGQYTRAILQVGQLSPGNYIVLLETKKQLEMLKL